MKILIIEDDPSVNSFLREVALAAGHVVESADTGEDGITKYESFAPDLIFADVRLPDIDGLQILERIRKRNSEVVFVAMTGLGSVDVAVRALELKANNFLQKPIRLEVIKSLMQKYDQMLRASHLREEVSRMVRLRNMKMTLPTRLDLVGSVVELLVREASPWLTEQERFGIQLGLYELITNAVEHGNLGISYEEKQGALIEGPYHLQDLVARRMANADFARRKVMVEFKQTNERLEWIIQDEGEGFQWADLPNPLDFTNNERLNGRGIFLARFQFDALDFLGTGSKVRALKYIQSIPQTLPISQEIDQ